MHLILCIFLLQNQDTTRTLFSGKLNKLAYSRQQLPIPLPKLMVTSVNLLRIFPHKKHIGICCTDSLYLTYPLSGTAGDVFFWGGEAKLCSKNKIAKCFGFHSRISRALCPLSFQRNDIIFRQENVCAQHRGGDSCAYIYMYEILPHKYFSVSISIVYPPFMKNNTTGAVARYPALSLGPPPAIIFNLQIVPNSLKWSQCLQRSSVLKMPIVFILCISQIPSGESLEHLPLLGFTTRVHWLFTTDAMI